MYRRAKKMTVQELDREQLIELKQAYITEKNDEVGEGTSWGELADADDIISDKEIFVRYDGYTFTNDDFFCSVGRE
jgi:hypothetical protein